MKQQLMVFGDVYNESAARAQADLEKSGAFGWAAKAKLWDRPKDADIALVSSEKRHEPLWHIKASRHVAFEVKCAYTVKASNAHALHTTLLGQTFDIPASRTLTLEATEHCDKRVELSEFINGMHKNSGGKSPAEYVAKYSASAVEHTNDLVTIDPEVTAAVVAQDIKVRLMEPVAATHILHDELVIHELLLYYRPVYAFEYAWRDKKGVVEIDALTGGVNREGNMLASTARGMMTRENLFDVGAEVANALVPGGGVLVKLVNVATKGSGAA
jgi:hypothetical protein